MHLCGNGNEREFINSYHSQSLAEVRIEVALEKCTTPRLRVGMGCRISKIKTFFYTERSLLIFSIKKGCSDFRFLCSKENQIYFRQSVSEPTPKLQEPGRVGFELETFGLRGERSTTKVWLCLRKYSTLNCGKTI